jgi:hypothetical protein
MPGIAGKLTITIGCLREFDSRSRESDDGTDEVEDKVVAALGNEIERLGKMAESLAAITGTHFWQHGRSEDARGDDDARRIRGPYRLRDPREMDPRPPPAKNYITLGTRSGPPSRLRVLQHELLKPMMLAKFDADGVVNWDGDEYRRAADPAAADEPHQDVVPEVKGRILGGGEGEVKMTTKKDLLAAMPLDGDDRITTAGQLEAYVKAVCAGAMGGLGAKAGPTQALRAAIIVEDIMSTFMVSGNAVFCGQRFVRNLEK